MGELEALRAEVADLKERLAYYEGAETWKYPWWGRVYGLTPQQALIVDTLLRANGRTISHTTLCELMENVGRRRNSESSADYLLKVQVSKARVALKRLGVDIKNEWGAGYYITREDKAKFEALREAALNRQPVQMATSA